MKYTTIIGTVLAALSLTVTSNPIPETALVPVAPGAFLVEHGLEDHNLEEQEPEGHDLEEYDLEERSLEERATSKPTTNKPTTNKPTTNKPAAPAAPAQRKIEEKPTATYAKVKSMLGRDLTPGFYKLTLTWDLGSTRDAGTAPEAIRAERTRLGFDHIAVVVGQVTRTKTVTTATKEVWQNDFTGWMGDMVGITTVQNHVIAFRAPGAGTRLTLRGTIAAANAANPAFRAKGDAYVAAHPNYDARTNNCNSYAQAVLAQL